MDKKIIGSGSKPKLNVDRCIARIYNPRLHLDEKGFLKQMRTDPKNKYGDRCNNQRLKNEDVCREHLKECNIVGYLGKRECLQGEWNGEYRGDLAEKLYQLNKKLNKKVGGSGHIGHTVIDTVYHGRPEYGFYTSDEMTKMNAKVGGSMSSKRLGSGSMSSKRLGSGSMSSKRLGSGYLQDKVDSNVSVKIFDSNSFVDFNKKVGGSGHIGHTVIDTVYHGRPEYGFYTSDEMSKMNAKVGGFAKESIDEHLTRIKGIIENMINISKSPDTDILEVISNEINPKTNNKYGNRNANELLKTYYRLNPKQKGGNRVTLPLSFYTGDIPNKINISTPTQNYCA